MSITAAHAWAGIREMLERIEEPTRTAYLAFHDQHTELAVSLPASVRHHHAWPGGYPIHIWEVMCNLRDILNGVMLVPEMGFTRTDAIVASYVHDLDKLLYRYEKDAEPPTYAQKKLAQDLGLSVSLDETKASISERIDAKKKGKTLDESRLPKHAYREDALAFEDGAIVMKLCADHNLPLSFPALHAVCVHHGGFSPLARTSFKLDVEPLGCFLHCADYISSNVQLGNTTPKTTVVPPPPAPPHVQ